MKCKFITLLFFFLLISYTPLADWLEASMLRHMLLQIPLLVLIGYYFGQFFLDDLPLVDEISEKGVAGILLVSAVALYWMLPRALDASLIEPYMASAKYFSLTFLLGAPLALSWKRLHPIFRAVVLIELLAMLLRLGWLYLVSPVRLCNAYQLSEQIVLGKALLVIAAVLSLYWTVKLFTRNYQPTAGSVKTS